VIMCVRWSVSMSVHRCAAVLCECITLCSSSVRLWWSCIQSKSTMATMDSSLIDCFLFLCVQFARFVVFFAAVAFQACQPMQSFVQAV
jgi:hypothetical protein